MPDAWWRWKIAQEFGWTLEQVDALSVADMHEYWQIRDGEANAQASLLLRKR